MLLLLSWLCVGDVFDVLGHKAELGEVRSRPHGDCLCQLNTGCLGRVGVVRSDVLSGQEMEAAWRKWCSKEELVAEVGILRSTVDRILVRTAPPWEAAS